MVSIRIVLFSLFVSVVVFGLLAQPDGFGIARHPEWQHYEDYRVVIRHILGFAGKPREVAYGKVSPNTARPSNGSIAEEEGWISKDVFDQKYRGKEPVVFRKAATKANGWNIECLSEGDLLANMRRELGDKKVRIFRDEYDDSSCDYMTFADYELLVAESRANKSLHMPYPRALPVQILETCSGIVPEETLKSYHAPWAFSSISTDMKQLFLFVSLLKGTTTKMHMDVGESFFTQVYGRKRWLLIDPEYATQLKVYGDTLNLVYVVGYDVWLEAVPPHIPVKEVVLEPGDVLYFPGMTFHAVQNLEPITVGVDQASVDIPQALKRNWVLTLGSILNPFLITQLAQQFWRTGKLNGHDLYFEGFSETVLKKQKEL